MARCNFNFYEQHERNSRATIFMKVMLPVVLALVTFVLYFFVNLFLQIKTLTFSFTKVLLDHPLVSWLFVAWWAGWCMSVYGQMAEALQSPLKKIMNANLAYPVSDLMLFKDPKLRLFDSVVGELSLAYGMPKPDIYIVENTNEPNAFAVETIDKEGHRNGSGVAITRPLLKMLNRNELSGVLGHELAHINADDSKTVVSFVTCAHGLCGISTSGWQLYESSSDVINSSGWFIGGLMAPFAILGFVFGCAGSSGKWFAILLRYAMSRTREYDADAMSVKVNQDKEGLISALTKIDNWANQHYGAMDSDPALSKEYSALYFFSDRTHWYDDHPSTKSRIKRLKEM